MILYKKALMGIVALIKAFREFSAGERKQHDLM